MSPSFSPVAQATKLELPPKLRAPDEEREKPGVPVAPSSHWNWVVSEVTTQPRPSLSVMTESARQKVEADKVVSPTRTWPSLSWPKEPEAPPEAVSWKQQLSLRPTRA